MILRREDVRRLVRSPRALATAVFALGGVAIYALNFPGSMEDDSFAQLVEARTKSYSFWHPPIMSWLLGVSDSLPGPPEMWFILLDMGLAFSAFAAILWLGRRVSWTTVALAALFMLLPHLLLLQAVVWKDGLFADSCLASFVVLAMAAARWQQFRLRLCLLGLSAVLMALAMLARQNGFIFLPCATAALAWIAARREGRWRQGGLYAAAYLLLSGGLALGANALLELRSDGLPAQEEQFKVLHLYDITGMVKRDSSLPLPILQQGSPELTRLIRTQGVRLWSPVKNDTLETSWQIVTAMEDTPADVLTRQWNDLVLHRPLEYLAVRLQLFSWVFWPAHVARCHPYHIGDEGNPADLAALGLKSRMDARDIALGEYAHVFVGTPVFWHPAYAALALLMLFFLLRWRSAADIAIAALLVGALLFTASFFVISIACDYRYLYVLDLAAMAGALYVCGEWKRKRGPAGPL